MLGRFLLYARTLRHLRLRQLAYQPLRRLQGSVRPGALRDAPVDERRLRMLAPAAAALGPEDADAAMRRATEVLEGRFTFLAHTEQLPAIDWRGRYGSHLWSFQLHYFDYARDLAYAWRATGDRAFAARFGALAEGWIAATDDGAGDGWAPYTIALRSVNWLMALALFGDALEPEVRDRIGRSVHRQLLALERRLEWQHLANHLQKDLHALAVGSLLFDGPHAARWRRRWVPRLWRELEEQILEDGGHAERAPAYHAIALADCLEIVALMHATGEQVPATVVERVRAMARAFGMLSREDGSLHLLNDSAEGFAPSRRHLDRLSRETIRQPIVSPDGEWSLPLTGYFGFRDSDRGDRVIVDCGEMGPSHNLAHAHCDLLSYELDLGGRPVVVDAGVHGYEGDRFREYVRSTRAHNTVMVGGREQSEMWGTFRVARRARVHGATAGMDGNAWTFRGAYSPYFDRRVRHGRDVRLEAGVLIVTDTVRGADGARLDSFIHLHPRFDAQLDRGRVIASAADQVITVEAHGHAGLALLRAEDAPVQGWHCPAFGRALPQWVVLVRVERADERPFGYAIRKLQPDT